VNDKLNLNLNGLDKDGRRCDSDRKRVTLSTAQKQKMVNFDDTFELKDSLSWASEVGFGVGDSHRSSTFKPDTLNTDRTSGSSKNEYTRQPSHRHKLDLASIKEISPSRRRAPLEELKTDRPELSTRTHSNSRPVSSRPSDKSGCGVRKSSRNSGRKEKHTFVDKPPNVDNLEREVPDFGDLPDLIIYKIDRPKKLENFVNNMGLAKNQIACESIFSELVSNQ